MLVIGLIVSIVLVFWNRLRKSTKPLSKPLNHPWYNLFNHLGANVGTLLPRVYQVRGLSRTPMAAVVGSISVYHSMKVGSKVFTNNGTKVVAGDGARL